MAADFTPKGGRGDKGYRGDASQFFIAGELCRRGLVAVITMGNCPNTDILCSNSEGTKFVHIQVKTFIPGSRTCSVGMKAEKAFTDNFFWILGGIPLPGQDADFEYYVIPAKVMAEEIRKDHALWLSTPGKKGQSHNTTSIRTVSVPPYTCFSGWDISPFKNRWDLIEERLL